jgi:hypothetical protein
MVTILLLQHLKKSADGFTFGSIITRIPFGSGFVKLARDLGSKRVNSSAETFDDVEANDRPPVSATKRPGACKLLKEKSRRGFQLLGGFKQEPPAHTLLALFVSLNFH